jgi:molecular chaperone GrpE
MVDMDNTQQPDIQKESETEFEGTNQSVPESYETLTGSDDSKLETDLKKAHEELAESKDKYLRMYSEFENFRRRTAKEKLELIQSASEQVVKSMLPVLDDFERAEKAFLNIESKELEGFLLIYNKFKKVMEQTGAKPMDVKSGSDFDADLHEAITQIPAPDEKLKGKVVDVVEKGYVLNEKVIRFAKVVIGS